MLYTVIENKLGIIVQATYDEIGIQRVEARRMEKEKKIAEEATEALKDKRKSLIIDNEEIMGSTSQPEPSQADAEVNVSNVEANTSDVEMKDAEVEVNEANIEAKLNKYKVDDDDEELNEMFGDEDEDDDDKDDKDENDNKDNKDDKGEDDDHDGASGLLITKPSGPSTIEGFLNDELNKQREEDQHQGESSSETKHADFHEVFLNLPKVNYLNHTEEEGELVEKWTTGSMLDRLDMEEDRFKFDIEEEIPPTPNREYTFKFFNEANNFNDVIIEEGSDSDQDTPFHYSGLDDDFPTFDELFRSHNEDKVRRKVVEKIATEGVPETVSKEYLLEERKRWFKAMPKERKFKRPLQFFIRHPDKSLGDILWWGYLEDLKVYAIKREFGVEFLSDIKTLR
ncbi:hypothetical protein Hanom_Chr06g00547481 [Helianthus anomalus]